MDEELKQIDEYAVESGIDLSARASHQLTAEQPVYGLGELDRRLLGELNPRRYGELAVDMSQMCLDGPWRDKQALGDFLVAESFGDQQAITSRSAGVRLTQPADGRLRSPRPRVT